MKKIRQGLASLLTFLLIMSTLLTVPAVEVQAQTAADQGQDLQSGGPGPVMNPGTAVDQVTSALEQRERGMIQAAFQAAASDQEIVDPTVYNWPTIGLGRLEHYDGLSVYLTENEKYLQQNWNSVLRKVTDLARISLAVGAAQGNPRDFGGKDLIAEIYNYDNIEAQGINGPIFALIALDSGSYEVPTTAKWTQEKLLDIILNRQLADGGYSLDGTGEGDVDLTAMAIQALAPYYKAGQPEVKVVVDKALDFLTQNQEADGGFKSWGTENSESVCQVIIALCSLGIDINTDTRFIKNSNTLLSELLSFKADDGGFKHTLDGAGNDIASEQALVALAAYVRFLNQKSALYDYQLESQISTPSLPAEQPGATIPRIVRIAGADCYATAVEIAKENFPQGAETVVLARGDVSADALPAVPLAKKYQAPLLLTLSNQLPDAVSTEIQALGAKKVLIMGGEGAVGKRVADTLNQRGIQVQRVFGNDQYGTAYEIAKLLGSSDQAVIVSGDYVHSYADALSISAWAAYNSVPILYSDKSAQLPSPTQQAISELGVKKTFLIGGTAVLPQELEKILPDPQRFSGQTLYDTNTAVLSQLQPNPTKLFVATGSGFADALAGAAVAGQSNAWILLTPKASSGDSVLTDGQDQLLQSARGQITETYVLGGAAVIPDSMLQVLKQILE